MNFTYDTLYIWFFLQTDAFAYLSGINTNNAGDVAICKVLSIQLFQERLSQKLCTRQSRKVIWDMINTLVLDTVAVEPTFVVSFSPRKHTSMASRAILWNFFEKQWTKNHPQYLSRLSRALFPTTFLETAVNRLKERLEPMCGIWRECGNQFQSSDIRSYTVMM